MNEMGENLVIVESPAKAKTIEKFLGKAYTVKSSFGHIRDLKKKGLGIDIEHGFLPQYEISSDKKKTVTELSAAAKKAQTVWLASDEDREGEAIAWHLSETLGLPADKTRRIVFHEITKNAILEAIENPRDIDMNLVKAQQARRVLDRLAGVALPPARWQKTQAKASGQGSGEESKITISLTNTTTFAADNGTDVLKGGFAATVEGFKVATYQYKSTSKPITPDQYSMRVYKSAVFYIEAPEGKTIKSLTFKGNDYDNGKYIKDLTGVEGTEGSAVANSDGTIGPWEGSASVVILQAAAAQTRLESVDVVFE